MYNIKIKVAVIAGTKTDTAMGVEYINQNSSNFITTAYPVSENPQQQTLFQISDTATKEQRISEIIIDAKQHGITLFFVYCNSLSGAVDFDKLAIIHRVGIITPLAAYFSVGRQYNRIGVIAANNQSLAKIESKIMSANENCEVIGTSLLPVVKLIEEKKSPKAIIHEWKLHTLMKFYENACVQTVVLGCTHFPWFEAELKKCTRLPIFNPSEYMLNELQNLSGMRS